MSYTIALGGVACTTKTSILKKFSKHYGIKVHLSDYKELHDTYEFDHRVGSLLYAAYNVMSNAKYLTDYNTMHMFDRHPMEALVYESINKEMSVEDTRRALQDCVKMGFFKYYKCVVMRAKPHTEKQIVRMMKKRNNRIDRLDEDYVRQQDERFAVFAEVVSADEYEIDCTGDLNEQQREIETNLLNTIYRWTLIDDSLHVYEHRLPIIRNKIAAFDLDGTIIETKSGRVYSENAYDWKFKYTSVVQNFIDLLRSGYTIVVVTNQLGVTEGKVSAEEMRAKIEYVCTALSVPLVVMMATRKDRYRKPRTGTMEYLLTRQPNIKKRESFFCGDNVNGTLAHDSDYARACNMKFLYDFEYFV
ncbi:NRK1 [Alphabaculovirus myunipunctae]|uniref:NRK1 n=1 Tax=Mythimna unipuncta nucleopolyhedrovirus TaxID=447897 RepID=A0A2K9VSB2_9ABAC|nr:NRK1 [Mythimna unipuncta nucleopolyhedrovirus]AUV65330.1 NRK1 [Mythimna unipuncta nucleopolyhedrovirus]